MKIASNTNVNMIVSTNSNAKVTSSEILEAKIVSVEGDNVTISTKSGETIEAKLDGELPANKNQVMSFFVKHVGDKVILTPADMMQTRIDSNSKVLQFILKQNSIEPSEKNMEIVDVLLDNKMPVNKQLIETVAKFIDKLFMMTNCEDNEKIVSLLKSEDVSLEDIKNFIKDKITTSDKQISSTEESVVKDVTKQVKEILSNIKIANGQNQITQNSSVIAKDSIGSNFTKAVVMLMKMDLDINLENLKIVDDFMSNDKGFIDEEIKDILEFAQKDEEQTVEKNKMEKPVQGEIKSAETEVQKKAMTSKLEGAETKILKSADDESDKLKETVKDTVKKFINKIKSTTIQKGKIDVEDITKDLKALTKNLQELQKGSVQKNSLDEKIRLVDQKISFVNNLNQTYNVMYMPVELNFNDLQYNFALLKKNKASSEKKVGFYITVHTKNLDKIEVVCNIDNKRIQVKFFSEDDKTTKILEENKAKLIGYLSEEGFDFVDLRTSKKEDDSVILQELMKKSDNKNFLFDVRV